MNSEQETRNSFETDEAPDFHAPILGAWSRLYAAVIGELVVLIILFYLFMKAFE